MCTRIQRPFNETMKPVLMVLYRNTNKKEQCVCTTIVQCTMYIHFQTKYNIVSSSLGYIYISLYILQHNGFRPTILYYVPLFSHFYPLDANSRPYYGDKMVIMFCVFAKNATMCICMHVLSFTFGSSKRKCVECNTYLVFLRVYHNTLILLRCRIA